MLNELLIEMPVVQGGLTLMVAGWLGYQLRAIPRRLFALVRGVATRVIEIRDRNPLYDAWLSMATEGAVRRGGPRALEVRSTHRGNTDPAANARFVAGSEPFWAKIDDKWCRVFVEQERADERYGPGVRSFKITIEVLWPSRGDLTRMMRIAKERTNVVEDRQFVDVCNSSGANVTLQIPKRLPETMCMPQSLIVGIETRLRAFLDSRDEYERIGVPWRFGILLHGEPGTGKTSLAHVLASQLERRLAVIPLADVRTDGDLIDAFQMVTHNAVLLLEDIDCLFNQRDSKTSGGITFSGILNCIDGMLAPHNGRVLIMSTNHVDKLDPALIRPGRVDLKIEVPLLETDVAMAFVDRMFAHVADRHARVCRVMQRPRPTAAALMNELLATQWPQEAALSRTREAPEACDGAPETAPYARHSGETPEPPAQPADSAVLRNDPAAKSAGILRDGGYPVRTSPFLEPMEI